MRLKHTHTHAERFLLLLLLLLSGVYNPYEFKPPHSWGSEITHKNAPQSVGLLWTGDQPLAKTSTWQHTQNAQRTNIHAPGGIRTRNLSKRSAVDTRLRPLGHWDRQQRCHTYCFSTANVSRTRLKIVSCFHKSAPAFVHKKVSNKEYAVCL